MERMLNVYINITALFIVIPEGILNVKENI